MARELIKYRKRASFVRSFLLYSPVLSKTREEIKGRTDKTWGTGEKRETGERDIQIAPARFHFSSRGRIAMVTWLGRQTLKLKP